MMTGDDVKAARVRLGEIWGVGRPLSPIELARALGLSPTNGNDHVLNMEKGKSKVSGPIELLIEFYLSEKVFPPDRIEIFKTNSRGRIDPETGIMRDNPLKIEVEEVPEGAISADEAAHRLGKTSRTLSTMRSQQRGPKFWKVGANVYYDPRDVAEYASR